MEHYIPSFTDISNWNKKPYSSTGGTRAKKIYIDLQNDQEYFFKGSKKLKNGTFKYPNEFWSEIISSKVGQWLGFDLLDYNIAFDINDEQQIGCISKSMIVHTENKLSEGVEYLRGFDPSYIPSDDESRYTFNFIRQTLQSFELSDSEKKFVEMLVFDAIIGNSDRHQENWGFISDFKKTFEEINQKIQDDKNVIKKIGLRIKRVLARATQEISSDDELRSTSMNKNILRTQSSIINTSFSPIYDSGCCLGRELENEKIEKMLANQIMIEKYVLRGKAEVRWEEGPAKPKHFDLLKQLKNEFSSLYSDIDQKLSDKYSYEKLENLILKIDSNLPKELSKFKLSNNRKKLMLKLIPLRLEKVREV
ncbi:hypothetical protein E0K83_12455 [Gramella sp. BOM4]|nr:hypothetical protein [Christiangramia bathymodioli]